MRVLMITGSLPHMPCGVGDYTARLVSELSRIGGVDVEVLTTKSDLVTAVPGNPVLWLLMERWRLGEVLRVVRLLRDRSPDVVHVQHPTQGYDRGMLPAILPTLAYLMGIRVVQTWHEGFGPLAALSILLRCLTPGPVIVIKSDLRARLNPIFRLVASFKKFHPIGNAPAIPRSVIGGGAATVLRGSFGARHPFRLVVFFGFLYRHKGAELLFDIADPSTDRIVFAGDGNVDPEFLLALQRRAAEADWQGKVSFTGYIGPVAAADLLATADLTVLPFRHGAGDWNTSMQSALLNGCPVVTTSTSARGQDPQKNVWYSPIGDVADMRDAARRMQRTASVVTSHSTDWETIARKHLLIYQP